jgi:hypothetical protein
MTRRTFAGLLSVPLASAPAFAAETAKEKGKRLIGQVVDGLGGDAFRNMRTRTEYGRASSFYREQLTGYSVTRIYTKYLDPDAGTGLLEMQRQVFGKKVDDGATLYTTREGYDVTYRGAKPLADEKIKQFRENLLHDIFYILRERLSEPGMEFESAGIDVVENQTVEAIDIYDSDNRNIRVWVNAHSFFPVKQRYFRFDPIIGERREEVTRYTTYREAGKGVMWPYTTARERDTEQYYEMRSERVTIDDPLPDSMFELPNGIKMLK